MEVSLIGRAVERALGAPVVRAHPIKTEGESIVCKVELEERSVIFKADYPSSLRVQQWYAERLPENGVPTPAVLALDMSRDVFPISFAVFECVRGTPMGRISLEATPPKGVSRALGGLLRRIHEIRVEGVGWLRVDEAGDARGSNSDWHEMLVEQLGWGVWHILKHGLLPDSVVESLWRYLQDARALVEDDGQWCLLNGDVRPDHVFVEDGRITGIIDLQGRVGDPVLDFAHYAVQCGPGALDLLLEGYGPDADLRDRIARCLDLYTTIEMTGILRWFHEHPSPEKSPVVDALRKRIPERVAALTRG